MSTLNLGESNIFTDLGKVVNGTLLTNNVVKSTNTNMYSLALTKGVWICVFIYRSDQNTGNITYGGIAGGLPTGAVDNAGFTVVKVVTVTTDTQTVYAYTYAGSASYTWQSGGRECFAVKIA